MAWSSPHGAGKSLREIQEEELRRKAAEEEQRARNIQRTDIGKLATAWKGGSESRPLSLREIQAQEEKRAQQQQSATPVRRPGTQSFSSIMSEQKQGDPEPVRAREAEPPAHRSVAPRATETKASSSRPQMVVRPPTVSNEERDPGFFWDVPTEPLKPAAKKSAATKAVSPGPSTEEEFPSLGGKPAAKTAAAKANSKPNQKSGQKAKKKANRKEPEVIVQTKKPNAQLAKWCAGQLCMLNAANDEAIVSYVLSLKSGEEIQEYIGGFVGGSNAANAFVRELCDRQGLARPPSRAEGGAQSAGGGAGGAGKKKRKKATKKKLNASELFSFTSGTEGREVEGVDSLR